MIPPEVIFTDQLGKYVYIADKNNTIKRVDIDTDYSTRYYTSIVKGLKDGDRVIVSSLVKLKEGLKVIPKDVTDKEGIKAILKKKCPYTKKVDNVFSNFHKKANTGNSDLPHHYSCRNSFPFRTSCI